jgi:2-dehydro-3-deoxyphosphogluconate aldolase / (4S)-4-hydroxy-2-oxoglutarate aldolase
MVAMNLSDIAQHGPVIPVIVIHQLAHAVPMAQALVAGGIRMLEITLRTPAALQAIEAIARHVPQAIVGAGTVLSAQDAQAAHDAGSQFAVSPGYLPCLSLVCNGLGLPLIPGVATASEIMQARAQGHRLVKFFPAAAAGGTALLQAWSGPFSDIQFCPTGGITLHTAPDFLRLPNVPICGGSWLTPQQAMNHHNWPLITQLALEAASLGRH